MKSGVVTVNGTKVTDTCEAVSPGVVKISASATVYDSACAAVMSSKK